MCPPATHMASVDVHASPGVRSRGPSGSNSPTKMQVDDSIFRDALPHFSQSDDQRTPISESFRTFADGTIAVVESEHKNGAALTEQKSSNGLGAPDARDPSKHTETREGCDGRGGCGRPECQPLNVDEEMKDEPDLDDEDDSEARVAADPQKASSSHSSGTFTPPSTPLRFGTPLSRADSATSAGPSGGEPKRRSKASACLNCRRSHASCDAGRPCSRCIKRGLASSCEPPARAKGSLMNVGGCQLLPRRILPMPQPGAKHARTGSMSNIGSEVTTTLLPAPPAIVRSGSFGGSASWSSPFPANINGFGMPPQQNLPSHTRAGSHGGPFGQVGSIPQMSSPPSLQQSQQSIPSSLPIDPSNIPAIASMVAEMLTAANGGRPPDPAALQSMLSSPSILSPMMKAAQALPQDGQAPVYQHGTPPGQPTFAQGQLNQQTQHMSQQMAQQQQLPRSDSGQMQIVRVPSMGPAGFQQMQTAVYQQQPMQTIAPTPIVYQTQVYQMAPSNPPGPFRQNSTLLSNPSMQPQGDWGLPPCGVVYEGQSTATPVFQSSTVTDELAALSEFINDTSMQFPPPVPSSHLQSKSPPAIEDLFSWKSPEPDDDISTPFVGSKRNRDGQHVNFPKCFGESCKTCEFNHIEKFYLVAAGEDDVVESGKGDWNSGIVVSHGESGVGKSDDAHASRTLSTILQAKHAAGLLIPYDYKAAYNRLARRISTTRTSIARQRLLAAALYVSEDLEPVWQTHLDTLASEEQFERLLLEHDRTFSATGMPAALWRRTGEIMRANREFAGLVGVPLERLSGGRVNLFELMTEDSEVAYWDKWTGVAADGAQKAVMMSCSLVRGGKQHNAPLHCAFSFTIRRDAWEVPSAIVGNFLPSRPPPLLRVLFERLRLWGEEEDGSEQSGEGGEAKSKKRNVGRGTGALGMFGLDGGSGLSLGEMARPTADEGTNRSKDDFTDFLNLE